MLRGRENEARGGREGDPTNGLVKKNWVTGAAGIDEQQCGGDKTGNDTH